MQCAVSFLSVVVLCTLVLLFSVYIVIKTKECGSTYFKCTEDNSCIPAKHLCNKIKNCPNGSDELNHVCADLVNLGKFFEPHIKPKSNVTRIRASEDECYVDSPVECNCTYRSKVYCENATWNRVPWKEFGSNTTSLVLKKVLGPGAETEVEDMTEPTLTMLRKLTVEGHQFFPFWNLLRNNKDLVILSLIRTGVTRLEPGVITEMKNLTMLFMDHNGLNDFDESCLSNLPSLFWLNLEGNNLTLENFTFRNFPELRDIIMPHNKVREIGENLLMELGNLTFLDLRANEISIISERAFTHNKNLADLNLSHNRIKTIKPSTFVGLGQMTKLNISYNPLTEVSSETYCSMERMQSLYLEGLEIDIIDLKIFKCFNRLEYVFFEKFSYCRFAPNVPKCYPMTDGLSTNKNLLNDTQLRLVIWFIATLTIFGNMTVLVTRWYTRRKRKNQILDVFINNLAGADIISGFYLITLAIQDMRMRENYHTNSYIWSQSQLCSTIGAMAMISYEVSLLVLTIMSLERYLVISGPISSPKLSRKLAHCSMIVIWLFVIALAITPVLRWRGRFTFYGSSGLCFPLHLDDPFAVGWEYSAFVFIGLNSICLILISVSYGKLFCVIRQTRLSTPLVIRDLEMALRFFFMVLSDFLCWVPMICFKIAVLDGYQIPPNLHSWLLVFILPLNSAINPFLYTFTTGSSIKFIQQLLTSVTRGSQHTRGTSGTENHCELRNATIDTPCNSTLVKKDDGFLKNLKHQDSVTSK